MYFINKFNKCLILLISFLTVSHLSYSADDSLNNSDSYLDFERIGDSSESQRNVINLEFENDTDYPIQITGSYEKDPTNSTYIMQIDPHSIRTIPKVNLNNIKEIRVRYLNLGLKSQNIDLEKLRTAKLQAKNSITIIIRPWVTRFGLSAGLTYTIKIDSERNTIADSPEVGQLKGPEELSTEKKEVASFEPETLKELGKLENLSSEEKQSDFPNKPEKLKFKESEQPIDAKQKDIVLSEMLGQPLASIKEKTIEPWDVFDMENPYEKINDHMSYMVYMTELVKKMNELKDKFVNEEFSKELKRKYDIEDIAIQSKIINKNYRLLQEILNKIEK